MKEKENYLIESLILLCVPGMTLFFMILICYMSFIKTGIVTNVYEQVICLYGINIFLCLCLLPMKITKSRFCDIGLCRNKKKYQDVLTLFGLSILIGLFLYENTLGKMDGAYVLQFIFVGLGEEIFFRAVLFHHIKKICKSDAIAILIVAFVFGSLFHFDGGILALLLIRMPLSILFSILYRVTGSLYIPMILHGIYDILI